ncbi:MAG: hypothetical protein VB089_21165 [Anaerolineaceae bacterium]|jgi:hypothetical protein|nr:hypothetical protein [Anaerolineaceae bacterium]
MRELSPTAWIVLICLAGLVIVFNVGLVTALRQKDRPRRSAPISPMQKMQRNFKNSHQEEDELLRELSRRVKELPSTPPDESQPEDPAGEV